MTTKEKRVQQNVERWRNLSDSERHAALRSSAVRQVIGSMAMEGEPVSKKWITENSR